MKANEASEQYISKSALVAEIERRIASLESIGSENYLHDNCPVQYAMLVTLKSLKFSINTLKVKEIDLEKEEPVSEDLEEAAKNHAAERYRTTRDKELAEKCKWSFKAGANWKRDQIAKENMLLPFKEYDNLIESINKRKKEGYEAGYKQGLVDPKSEQKPTLGIEIPFGAKDSELIEKTISIPEGCYVIIKDNKIIIRKEKFV